jgi:elongation factor 1-beta
MPHVWTALSLRKMWLFRSIEVESERPLAKVLASIKIFPNDANLDLEVLKSKIQQALPAGSTVQKFEEDPIAFGLVALIAHVVLPEDVEGKMDQVEESIRAVDWVSEIQVLQVGRF